MGKTKKHSIRQPFRTLLPIGVWVLIWQLSAIAVNKVLLIPRPWEVFVSLGRLASTAIFWKTAGMTLLRIIIGTLAGTVLGCILAVLTKCSEIADAVLSPVIRLVRATPEIGRAHV